MINQIIHILVVLTIHSVLCTHIFNATGFEDFPSQDESLALNEGGLIVNVMKEIQLTQGKVALVDDADYEYLNQWKWHASKGHNSFYARRYIVINKKETTIYMHQLILGKKRGLIIDHKNTNGLDNQRENLRHSTVSQNSANRRSMRNSASKYLGVSWDNHRNKWIAQICIANVIKKLGASKDEIDCAILYNIAARKYHGEFARTNNLLWG